MPEQRWQRTLELFHLALEVEPKDREAWLARACGEVGREDKSEDRSETEQLRREVERLLRGHENAPTLLDQPEDLHSWGLGSRGLCSWVSPDALFGTMIGPFRIESWIGEGGMGVVYRAHQEHPIQRSVALKLIQAGMATREVLARFEAERQALAALNHPNIATVFDAGTTREGRPYFAMELVEGEAITEYCDRHSLPLRQRTELFLTVCQAVHYAHQKGIIHRDLKPSNVLIAEQVGQGEKDPLPVVKVIDFGVARAVHRQLQPSSTLTDLGRPIGTPGYMSPEQTEGALDIDTRTDVYSLGVLLYELLVGCLPLGPPPRLPSSPGTPGQDSGGILRRTEPLKPSQRVGTLGDAARDLARRRGTPPGLLCKELRGDLDWVVMKALEGDRDRRYGSASALADDLGRHLRDEPVLAGPPGIAYRAGKFAKRYRVGVSVAALVAFLLLTFTVVTFLQTLQLRQALETTRKEARKAEEVSTFLVSLFQSSDPAEARGDSVTAREILDRGADRLSTDLKLQPEIQGLMMGVIGETYTNLGLFSEAESLLGQSLQVRRESLGEGHPEVADSHHRLAYLRQWQGDYKAAVAEARKSLALRLETLDDTDPKLASSFLRLGTALRFAGQFEEAEGALQSSLDRWRTLAPPERPEVATTLNELGVVLRFLGRFVDAEAVLRRAVAAGQRDLPEDHPNTAVRKLNLASVLGEVGRDTEAEILLREALATRRRIYGDEHVEVATCLNNLARACLRQGKRAEAEALHREALEMYRRLLGPNHLQVAIAAVNLGVLLRKTGRLQEAEALYREGLGIQQKELGADHPRVAIAHHNLANLLRILGSLEEAEVQIRRAIEILRLSLGDQHPDVPRSSAVLGRILTDGGHLEEAEAVLRQAEEVQREALPPGHWRTMLTRMFLGDCLTRQDRWQEAETLLQGALDGLREARGEDDENTLQARTNLVALYQAWDRPTDADRYRNQPPNISASSAP